MANQAAAGWYPDPNSPGQRRYWDGTKWTEHTDGQAQPAQPRPAQQAQPVQPQPVQHAQPVQPQPVQHAQPAQPVRPAVPAQPQAPAAPRPQAPVPVTPQAPGFPPGGGASVQSKPGQPGLGVAGFVCGLVGLILSVTIVCWFIGLPLAIAGTVLGALGMKQANETGAPKGLSMAGLICGVIGIVAGVIITTLVVVL